MDNVATFTGYSLIIYSLYRFISFIFLYLIPSSLKKYQRKNAYALITGSTDGIGKGIAFQLASKGFNIILHGRNEEKIIQVQKQLNLAFPDINVVYWIHDAMLSNIINVENFAQLDISLLVNNVGAGDLEEFDQLTSEDIDRHIHLNAIFPTQVTRAFLGLLKKPAMILNISSFAAVLSPAYLAVYSGAKSFNIAFSKSLSVELNDVDSMALIVGGVHSNSNKEPVSFFNPSSESFAKHVVARIGCGKSVVYPYWPHALQAYLMFSMPSSFLQSLLKGVMYEKIVQKKK